MTIAVQNSIFTRQDRRDEFDAERSKRDDPGSLEINVIYTTELGARAALRAAGNLARNLHARVNLVAVKEVPLGFPLSRPPVAIQFTEERLYEFACEGVQGPVETTVQLCYCRKKLDGLLKALKPNSLVIVGGRKSFWPTWERRLAETLMRSGHQVILASAE